MPGQVYATNTLGGNFSVPYLTDRLRHQAQPMFVLRQFIDVVEAVGKGRGDTFNFDKVRNVATQGGTLVETNTIPETNFTVNQGTATINEFGNSVPFTGKLDALSQFDIPPTVEQSLRDDMVKTLESAAGDQYTAADFIAVNTSGTGVTFTTNGTATDTATANLTANNVRAIVNFMRKKLIPKYDGANYICVGSVEAIGGLHSDTATGGWQDISKYTAQFAQNIFNGEAGLYYMTRFVDETGYLSNSIGASSLYGQAVFFGSDAVYEASSIPEEIRTKIPQDFGRDQGLAWYALMGFKKVWDFATDAEEHIVFVTSA